VSFGTKAFLDELLFQNRMTAIADLQARLHRKLAGGM
jgi:hypothetical protein